VVVLFLKETLTYSRFVMPAQAGIQENQGAGHGFRRCDE
jgi:hypothetical protein